MLEPVYQTRRCPMPIDRAEHAAHTVLSAITELNDVTKFLSCDAVAKLATSIARASLANIQGGGTMTARQDKWLGRIEQAYREGFADACDKFPEWTHTDTSRHWQASVSASYAKQAATAASLKRPDARQERKS